MIEHRDLGRNRGRVAVRQVNRTGTEADPGGLPCEACQEDDAGGDRLGPIADMLAHERLAVAELVCQDDCLAILREAQREILPRRMQGHREEPEFHRAPGRPSVATPHIEWAGPA